MFYYLSHHSRAAVFFCTLTTLYISRKPLQHFLATGVPSCEEPGSAHEQTCKISREELPHPIKQRQDELRKRNFSVSLPLRCRLLILVDSCAEWGWPDTLGTIQGITSLDLLFEPNISVCILVAISGRYGTLCRVPIYVCMCLKVSVKNGQLVRVFVF